MLQQQETLWYVLTCTTTLTINYKVVRRICAYCSLVCQTTWLPTFTHKRTHTATHVVMCALSLAIRSCSCSLSAVITIGQIAIGGYQFHSMRHILFRLPICFFVIFSFLRLYLFLLSLKALAADAYVFHCKHTCFTCHTGHMCGAPLRMSNQELLVRVVCCWKGWNGWKTLRDMSEKWR